MTPIKRRYTPSAGEKKIPSWVPIAIILFIFLVIVGITRYGVRGFAAYNIYARGEERDRENVLLQKTRYSCVPCSLVMLLEDQNIDVSAAEIAWISGTDLYGTNPEGIVAVGNAYGFDVVEAEMNFDELMDANKPAILYFNWSGNLHAVYVKPDRRNNYLIVKNPAMGLTRVYKNGVWEYFGSDRWNVYLFE